MFKPTLEQFFNKHGQDRTKPDISFLKNHFYREGRLTEDQALWILEKGTDILKKESNVLQVDAPITGAFLVFHSLRAVSSQPATLGQSVETFMGNMCVVFVPILWRR